MHFIYLQQQTYDDELNYDLGLGLPCKNTIYTKLIAVFKITCIGND